MRSQAAYTRFTMLDETVTLRLPEELHQPPEHQAELAAIARGRTAEAEMVRYDELLEQSAAGALGDAERSELEMLRREADRFMLIKAHAAVLLRWRGHDVPVR